MQQQQKPMGGELFSMDGIKTLSGYAMLFVHGNALGVRNCFSRFDQGYALNTLHQFVPMLTPPLMVALSGPKEGDEYCVMFAGVQMYACIFQRGASWVRRLMGQRYYSWYGGTSVFTLMSSVDNATALNYDSLAMCILGVLALGLSETLALTMIVMGICHAVSLTLLKARDARRVDLVYDEQIRGRQIADGISDRTHF